MRNQLHFGDNLDVLRSGAIAPESVDLIYLDPPFNSNANYNILFRAPSGEHSDAQIEAFEDTWHWNDKAERAFDDVIQSGNQGVADLLRAMLGFLGRNDMMAYLAMMASRLIELHKVLKPSGSLYLHCDPTASHYLKLVLDGVFGPENYLNEIIWKRTSAHSSARRYGPVHDVILFYGKTSSYAWNRTYQPYDESYIDGFYTHQDPDGRRWRRSDLTGAGTRNGETGLSWRGIDVSAKGRHWAWPPAELDRMDSEGKIHWPAKDGGMPMLKRYLEEQKGQPAQDIISDIPPMHNLAAERLGYPTQKPLALLERIIQASSNEGDVVLDPFCGCGTTIDAAQKLKRKWIGIDVTHLAITLIEKRLKARYGEDCEYEVFGSPGDLAAARELALRDKYQFQWWALSRVPGAQPFGGKKKGADGGIDGVIYFKPDGRTTERAIVSVKGGGTANVSWVETLAATIDREKAPIGLLVTLVPPTREMIKRAAAVGHTKDAEGNSYALLQILTVEDLFAGRRPQIPLVTPTAGMRVAAPSVAPQIGLFE